MSQDDDAALHRLEQVGLLVHDRLLLKRRHHAVGTRDDRVVEFAPAARRYRALLRDALVAGDDRGDVLAWLEPVAEQHRHVAAGGEADQIGAAGGGLRVRDRDEPGAHLRLHARDEGRAVLGAAAMHAHFLDRRANRAHGDEMAARLPAGAV